MCLELNCIQRIEAYKVDLFTYDEIRFDFIMLDGTVISKSEEESDWGALQQRLESLPEFNRDWFTKVYSPVFVEQRTVVYCNRHTTDMTTSLKREGEKDD